MKVHLYHIRLEVRGVFPIVGCRSLFEEYCLLFSSMDKALIIAHDLADVLEQKARVLGTDVDAQMPFVMQVEENPLAGGTPYWSYGYPL